MAGGNVIIVHRFSGSSKSDWYQWLKKALESKGFKAEILKMPSPEKHSIDECVSALEVSVLDISNTYFVGHGIGCQVILHFLARENLGRAKGALLVSPPLHLKESALKSPNGKRIQNEWLSRPLDFEAVKANVESIRIIASKDDPYISDGDAKELAQKLGAFLNTMPLRSHFTAEDGYAELHAALNEFMKM
ncbi:MAG: alpha/beta hydrolase [Candidatus Micrarchaeaceae archaeon]